MKTNFIIRSLENSERDKAVRFIENREIECAALMEKLLAGAEDVFVLENCENKKFCALFYIRYNSTLFHFVPFLSEEKNPDYNFSEGQKLKIKNLISAFLSDKKIFCIYGEAVGGEYLKGILRESGKEMITSFDYILMKNEFDESIEAEIKMRDDWKNLQVRKCDLSDVDGLLELERGYRKEEVQITEHEETDNVIQFVLNKSLASQAVFAAWQVEENSLKAIAKAATNACGKNYCQIGGVYCSPQNRNKGIMNFVMQHLLRYIHDSGKNASLFVKVNNDPAKKLYQNLGFVPVGKYMISYFQK